MNFFYANEESFTVNDLHNRENRFTKEGKNKMDISETIIHMALSRYVF